MKFLDLAFKVLSEGKKPMSASEIWEYASGKGYVSQLETQGRTPAFTLSARLYASANDSGNGKFAFVGLRPKRFYLPGITPSNTLKVTSAEGPELDGQKLVSSYKEKDLHCVLAYFIRNQLDAFPKTINHNSSKKREFGEWIHPDMVACYFPRHHWKTNVYELSQLVGDVQLGFYSFEIKQKLSFSNLRESFFQAVSNSSWADEGFLVTAEISVDIDFLQELSRLSRAFGIGVILLDPSDPDDSEVLYESQRKEAIEWDTVNKLSTINPDFGEFIERVKKDVTSKEIREEWYDKLLEADEIVKKFKNWGKAKR